MLLSYLEDCKDIMADYSSEWTSDMKFIIDRLTESSPSNPPQQEEQEVDNNNFRNFEFEEPKERPPFEDVVKPNTPDWAKKAFRKIALKTHPDKVKDSENLEELQDLYAEANRAVEEENYDLLLQICERLSIENSVDPEVELQYNCKRQELVKKELDKLTSTLPWVWGETCGDINSRKSLLISILPRYGLASIPHEKITEILEELAQS